MILAASQFASYLAAGVALVAVLVGVGNAVLTVNRTAQHTQRGDLLHWN